MSVKLYQRQILNLSMAYRTLEAYEREMRVVTLAKVICSQLPSDPSPRKSQRELSGLWPRMPCHPLCGYRNEMRRPHMSCWWFCRLRRYFYGKMDKKKFMYNRLTGMVITRNLREMRTHVILLSEEYFTQNCAYIVNIYLHRRFARVKDILMQKLFQLYSVRWIPHKKTILMICEGLAN